MKIYKLTLCRVTEDLSFSYDNKTELFIHTRVMSIFFVVFFRFPYATFKVMLLFLDVLLTVHLSIILVTDQLNAQILVL